MSRVVSSENLEELLECFAFVDDPRVQGRSKHLFIDILVMSVCAMLCGAETCTEIEIFGEQKRDWLSRYLELPCGIPSHDTIGRVLSIVDPFQMEAAFTRWVCSFSGEEGKTKSISLDGKSVAGTVRRFPKLPLHMISAYSHELGLSLAQTEANAPGFGEVEGAIECLKILNIKEVTVLADAGLSVKRITDQICEQKGHYVLPIKKNQRSSLEEMEAYFIDQKKRIKCAKTSEEHRGRKEDRVCELLSADLLTEHFREHWRNVSVVFRVRRKRESENKSFQKQVRLKSGGVSYEKNKDTTNVTESVTYYISSRRLTAKQALAEVRRHWGIENGLHWTLDVSFSEDTWKTRARQLAKSLSLIRKIAYNIIKRSPTKGSTRGRIKKAGWNNDFLQQLVFGQ